MTACVPSLEGQLYLTDPQSMIAYIWRKYTRTPRHAVPILGDQIISLPYQVARFGKQPDALASNIQGDLQKVLSNIFGTERSVVVSVIKEPTSSTACNLNISFVYSTLSGEVNQTGTTISLGSDGRLKIPEDVLSGLFGGSISAT